MEIQEVLNVSRIKILHQSINKKKVMELMTDCFVNDGIVFDKEMFIKDLNIREQEFSTYIGYEIAIPHAISKSVKKPAIAILKLDQEIDYGGGDELVKLFVMLAIPENSNDQHLKMLSLVATKLMHKDFRQDLMNLNREDEIYALLASSLK